MGGGGAFLLSRYVIPADRGIMFGEGLNYHCQMVDQIYVEECVSNVEGRNNHRLLNSHWRGLSVLTLVAIG